MAEEEIRCTGRTMDDLGDDLRVMEAGGNIKIRMCYLCKRFEGNESLALRSGDAENPFVPAKLKLYDIERRLDHTVLRFPLCQECLILLDLFE